MTDWLQWVQQVQQMQWVQWSVDLAGQVPAYFWMAMAGINFSALVIAWIGYRSYKLRGKSIAARQQKPREKCLAPSPNAEKPDASPAAHQPDPEDKSNEIMEKLREKLLTLKNNSKMNPAHYDGIREGVQAWNNWRYDHMKIHPELKEADLSNASLEKINLNKANLMGADLTGADLTKASLQSAILFLADLRGAHLNGANLQGATLFFAKLQQADLVKADLNRAILIGASMGGADLKLADLQDADLTKADLSQADLMGANLRGANLTKANLTGAKGLAVDQLCRAKSLFETELHPETRKLIRKINPGILDD